MIAADFFSNPFPFKTELKIATIVRRSLFDEVSYSFSLIYLTLTPIAIIPPSFFLSFLNPPSDLVRR